MVVSEGSYSRLLKCKNLQLVLLLFAAVVVNAQTDPCASNGALPSSVNVSFTTRKCKAAWPSNDKQYTLRFTDDTTANTLNIVLSVKRENRWYGIGFNQKNQMIGGSAMIGWVNSTSGMAYIDQFYLGGKDPSLVKLDSRLVFKTQPQAFTTTDTLYMAFQIDKAKSQAFYDYQLYAYGSLNDIPVQNTFNVHEDQVTVQFDYTSGISTVQAIPYASLAKAHGIVNIFGWGILLPVGAIIARYCRQWDPLWFYLHVGLQIIGFILIIAGLITGFQVGDKVSGIEYDNHQNLAVFIFVLAVIQISAILIRPKKDAKIRRYWNWYHHWAGRLALVLAAINIFVGIDVAKGGRKWKASYGLVLILEILIIGILEVLLWVDYLRKPSLQLGSSASLQMRHTPSGYPSSAPPVYDDDSDM